MYEVTLKPGHPSGVYHRSGRAFTAEPAYLSEEEITDAIRDDIWLNVKEVEEGEYEPPVIEHVWPEGADELIEHILSLEDPEWVQPILDWEMAGKQRVTVIKAAETRLEDLVSLRRTEPAEAVES